MKHLNRLYIVLAIAASALMALTACSGDDEFLENAEVPSKDGTYTYTLHLDCQVPDSMTGETTRATSSSWANGATLYLRFKNGSNYTTGTAVYNSTSSSWTMSTSLPVSTTSSTCEAYYFKNPGTISATSITLTQFTACYQGSGNYSHPTSTDVYVAVTLKPKNWRLRFWGRATGNITVLGSSSDISYYSSFNLSTGVFSSEKKDVTLSITNAAYSSYIYGFFASASTANKISVKTVSDGNTFSRTINGNTLQSKGSGWLYAPHSSNYTGWTFVNDNSFSATMGTTNYKADGDYWSLTVKASSGVSWTASASQTWVHFTSSKNSTYTGTGNGTVAVYVDANPTLSARSATVYVKSGSVTKTITITQDAGTLTATMGTTDYVAAGDYWSLTVTASSGISWTASASQTWVHFTSSKNSTYSGKGSGTVAVYVDANPYTTARTATVYVKSGSTTRSITIKQAGKSSVPITVTSVQVANVDNNWNFINNWGTTIYSYQTKYLTFKLFLQVNTAGYYNNLEVDLYSPGNVYEVTFSWDNNYLSTGSKTLTTTGWGKNTYGAWKSGQYKVIVSNNSQTLYTHYFYIY